ELVLEANPLYFRGKPKIDELHVQFIPDSGTLAVKVRAGELEYAPSVPATAVDAIRAAGRMRVTEAPTTSLTYLAYRIDAGPFRDLRLRRALALAIDRTAVAQKAALGYAEPAAELVPPWLTFATMRVPPQQELGAARALLNGQHPHLVMTTIAGSRALLATSILLQAAWKAIGADVELRPLQGNVIFAPDGVGVRGDFTFMLIGYGFAADADRSIFLSSHSIPPAGTNYARYRNAEVDRAIVTAQTTLDAAARRKAFATIAHRVATDVPYVPIVWARRISAVATNLAGVRAETVNSDFWNVYDWRLVTASRAP
ncbi:MAG: hypothetical protein JO101_02525, partial [Candidatus Eremiobacteraeota bacterium]|nr:hypothetical protein [Candidatus Eremiobacteraeota bacterium]